MNKLVTNKENKAVPVRHAMATRNPESIEGEAPTNPEWQEVSEKYPWWVLAMILLVSAACSIFFAIEMWRAPWADIFGWIGDHRAAGILLGTGIAGVIGGIIAARKS